MAVEGRLRAAGLTGIAEAVELGIAAAKASGLEAPRVTSDAKHVEIGLTDKADAARWVFRNLWRRGVSPRLVLIAGDEFGPLGGLPGSDLLLLVPESAGSVALTVGVEPTGAPPGVVHVRGGPATFLAVLEDQLARRVAGAVPDVGRDEGWTITVDGLDPDLERVHETLLVLADGLIGTNGCPRRGRTRPGRRGCLPLVCTMARVPQTELLRLPVWQVLAGRSAFWREARTRAGSSGGSAAPDAVDAERRRGGAFVVVAWHDRARSRFVPPGRRRLWLEATGASLGRRRPNGSGYEPTERRSCERLPSSGGIAAAAGGTASAWVASSGSAATSAIPRRFPTRSWRWLRSLNVRQLGFEGLLRSIARPGPPPMGGRRRRDRRRR